jgi:hypothetical protein
MADGVIYVLRILNEAKDGVFDIMNFRRELANLSVEKGAAFENLQHRGFKS